MQLLWNVVWCSAKDCQQSNIPIGFKLAFSMFLFDGDTSVFFCFSPCHFFAFGLRSLQYCIAVCSILVVLHWTPHSIQSHRYQPTSFLVDSLFWEEETRVFSDIRVILEGRSIRRIASSFQVIVIQPSTGRQEVLVAQKYQKRQRRFELYRSHIHSWRICRNFALGAFPYCRWIRGWATVRTQCHPPLSPSHEPFHFLHGCVN